jgi:peptidoglycan LD-endopeptidase CwlK
MPSFGKKSMERLKTCDQRLQDLFNEVIKNYDCSVLQGTRTKEEQDEFFRTGKSKVQWPNSKHNSSPSKGIDVSPYPIDWDNTKRFYHFAGYVQGIADQMGIKLRWGGDWDNDFDLDDQSFMDLVHFELVD